MGKMLGNVAKCCEISEEMSGTVTKLCHFITRMGHLSESLDLESVLTPIRVNGGFHLIAKIIRELKSHMIPYKFKCSHWLKLQHSDWRANYHQ